MMLRSIIGIAVVLAISFGIPGLMVRNAYIWAKARSMLCFLTGAAHAEGMAWSIWSLIILSILLGGGYAIVFLAAFFVATHIWAIVIGPVEKGI